MKADYNAKEFSVSCFSTCATSNPTDTAKVTVNLSVML